MPINSDLAETDLPEEKDLEWSGPPPKRVSPRREESMATPRHSAEQT